MRWIRMRIRLLNVSVSYQWDNETIADDQLGTHQKRSVSRRNALHTVDFLSRSNDMVTTMRSLLEQYETLLRSSVVKC